MNTVNIILLGDKLMDFRYPWKMNCDVLVNGLSKCDLQTFKCLGDFREPGKYPHALTEITVSERHGFNNAFR